MNGEDGRGAAGGTGGSTAVASRRARSALPGRSTLRAVLVDMGGVVLDLGEGGGRPWGDSDRRGRDELLERVHESGGRASEQDLERWVLTPWRRDYERRYRLGREAPLLPHFERLARLSGASAPPHRLLAAWAGPYLRSLRPMSGAGDALARLAAAELPLALVSNVPLPGRCFQEVLSEQGLAPHFRSLHFSYDAGGRKPGPLLVLAALASVEAPPEAAVLVGDRRSTDVAAGRAAGVETVWIRSADEAGPEPDSVIGSLAELPALLGL